MARHKRTAIELASDIGVKAYDLHAHGDAAAREALDFLWKVNPELFGWLLDRLMAARATRELARLRAVKAASAAELDAKMRQAGSE